MEGVVCSLGCSWHTNSGFRCGISDILTTPRFISPPPPPTLSSLHFSCLHSLRQARAVLGVGSSYEDSFRPRRGKREGVFQDLKRDSRPGWRVGSWLRVRMWAPLSNQQLEEVVFIGEMHLFWSDSPTSAWKKHYLAVSEQLRGVQGQKVQAGSISSLRSRCWPRFLFSGDDWRM